MYIRKWYSSPHTDAHFLTDFLNFLRTPLFISRRRWRRLGHTRYKKKKLSKRSDDKQKEYNIVYILYKHERKNNHVLFSRYFFFRL